MAIEILSEEAELLRRFVIQESKAETEELRRRILRKAVLVNFQVVSWSGSMKIEVFANEHPPPHFRVKHRNETANFAIADCRHLNGEFGFPSAPSSAGG